MVYNKLLFSIKESLRWGVLKIVSRTYLLDKEEVRNMSGSKETPTREILDNIISVLIRIDAESKEPNI